MPRYYLRLEPSGIEDVDGSDLPGPQDAIELAEAVAEDMAQNWKSHPPQHLILVKDETGAIIYERPLILH